MEFYIYWQSFVLKVSVGEWCMEMRIHIEG